MDSGEQDDADYTKPLFKDGRYQNPWRTWNEMGFCAFLKFVLPFTKDLSDIPKKSELDKTLPVVKPDFSQFDSSPESGVRHMWIGHASSLVQFDGITILTDPIFSERCSMVQFMGPKRYRPPPCSVEELPKVDCVVISHNHYDHLDYNTVKKLNKKYGDSLRWYVPQGLKQWMTETGGCQNVVELTWWQQHSYTGHQGNVTFVCTPCQHWSKRTATDTNKVLWSSWSIIGPKHRFYFAGDTGYCEGFKQIGRKYGPFDLATIPIGAYHPREFLAPQHVDPSQAVDIHLDIQSKTSVGIHWGTFWLTKEHYLGPRDELEAELKKREMNPSSFVTVNVGDVKVL